MVQINAVQTGWVQVRKNQVAARREDALRVVRTLVGHRVYRSWPGLCHIRRGFCWLTPVRRHGWRNRAITHTGTPTTAAACAWGCHARTRSTCSSRLWACDRPTCGGLS